MSEMAAKLIKNKKNAGQNLPSLLESFFQAIVLLVIFQCLLENLATIYSADYRTIASLALAGFLFDFLFSIEFVTRSVAALRQKQFDAYLLHQRGWAVSI